MDSAENKPSLPAQNTRLRFIRDAVMFQGKLLLDGARDLVLMPVALIASIIDLFTPVDPPGRRFYEVVHFGRQTERWIDLFEAAGRAPESSERNLGIELPSLDDFVDQFEQRIRAERENGDISAAAKEAIDRIMEAARNAASNSNKPR